MIDSGSSGSLQMVDHTLINVLLTNVYMDFPYYKGHCKVMCVSSPIYPVIIIIVNVRGAHQMLPDADWKAEDERGARARTSLGNSVNLKCQQAYHRRASEERFYIKEILLIK